MQRVCQVYKLLPQQMVRFKKRHGAILCWNYGKLNFVSMGGIGGLENKKILNRKTIVLGDSDVIICSDVFFHSR